MNRIYNYIETFPLFILELKIKRSQLTQEELWFFGNCSYLMLHSSRGSTLVRVIPDYILKR